MRPHTEITHLFLCCLLVCPAALGSEMYFLNAATSLPSGVYRADLDSNFVNPLVPGIASPSRIDVDLAGGRLYWTSVNQGVFSSRLDGSDVQTIRGASACVALTFDAVHRQIYWAEQNLIFRANPDGSNVTFIAATAGTALCQDLAIDPVANKLYASDWQGTAQAGAVRRMNLDGSAFETFVSSVIDGPVGLAIDPVAGRLYYARVGSASAFGAIRSISVSGGDDRLQVTNIRPRDIQLDLIGRGVYWNERVQTENPGIRRANLDDGLGIETLPLGDIMPTGIAYVPEPGSLWCLLMAVFATGRIGRLRAA